MLLETVMSNNDLDIPNDHTLLDNLNTVGPLYCWDCKLMRFKRAGWDCGDDSELHCSKGHWDIMDDCEPLDIGECMLSACDCEDYERIKG